MAGASPHVHGGSRVGTGLDLTLTLTVPLIGWGWRSRVETGPEAQDRAGVTSCIRERP
jgi:hypothetical protein